MAHWSDCAVHNTPAVPAGPCDCGGGAPGWVCPELAGCVQLRVHTHVVGPSGAHELVYDDGHVHNVFTCPAHTCGPAGSAQACIPPDARDTTTCNPYFQRGGCPDDGAFELTWVQV